MTTTDGSEWEEVLFLEPKRIEELHTTFKYHLYLTKEDLEAIDVVLVASLDRDIPGDPFWLYVIAPPGGVKTEVVRALRKYPKIYTLDTLTASTFISGKVEKDQDTGELYPVAGILENINGMVLVIKDFTVILSSPDITRTELYGQLRAIHDGYFEKAFGTLDTPIRVESKIGLIAAVTPAIDLYTKAHSILGERFLKIRFHPDPEKTAEKAFKNLGKEEKMREELATATAHYLKLIRHTKPPLPTKQQMHDLIKIARYIALMRTRIMCRYHQGRIVSLTLTEPEVPTRVVKQLKKLVMGLALLRQHNEVTKEDITTAKRVAKDCAIPTRQRIVESLGTFIDAQAEGHKSGVLPFQVQRGTKLPLNTVKNELEKMTTLGIVEEKIVTEKKEEENPKDKLLFYSFTNTFGELYDVFK